MLRKMLSLVFACTLAISVVGCAPADETKATDSDADTSTESTDTDAATTEGSDDEG